MKDKKVDVLRVESTKETKWGELSLFYKLLIILLVVVLLFIPILIIPNFN